MYDEYTQYLNTLNIDNNLENTKFKSEDKYCGILEHVSYELGLKYLNLIQTNYTNITYNILYDFVSINDKYGHPIKYKYMYNELNIECSPTSLRYIVHALIILQHFEKMKCENIVEVGCGYGGLCLAIQYFSKINNITIKKYNIVDLPDVCNLIANYLRLHQDIIYSNIHIHSAETYGENITDANLFFISNYCYTEVDQIHNDKYSTILLPKVIHGFITWQNGGNRGSYPIKNCSQITGKQIINVVEEQPQTDAGYGIYKNYYVYF